MAKFNSGSFAKSDVVHRATVMSVAMAAAGILPGTHIVVEPAKIGLLRPQNDFTDMRNSVSVVL